MPKPAIWLCAWVGLVPLLIALRGATIKQAALCGLVTGLVYYGIILYWITLFGYLPWILLIIYQALYFALFAALYTRLGPEKIGLWGYIAVPSVWTILQFIRTLGAYAFIWGSFSHTQANNPVIIQLASITGIWGIEFLVCLFNLVIICTLAPYTDKRRGMPAVIVAAITLAAVVFGYVTLANAPEPGGSARVAVIQGNMINDFHPIPNYEAHAFETYSRMSLQAARWNPDLIVWPETTLPTNIITPGWEDVIEQLAKSAHSDLLVGGYDPSMNPALHGSYNSLNLYNANGHKMGVYHKVQLVPFGEFVPLRDQLPFLQNYGIRPEDVLAAKSHKLLRSSLGKIGVSICFESLFPEIARTETRSGATALVVVTNDAWFQRTQAAREHEMMSRLRAVENRRYVIRAAGTGISAVIDPYGRPIAELGIFKQGVIRQRISPITNLTIFTRFGPWFVYVCLMAAAAGLIISRSGKTANS